MFEWFEKNACKIDFITLVVGSLALILGLTYTDGSCCVLRWSYFILLGLASVSCVVYIAYAIWLWCKRPLFDWHLINGHFLRRVCCLVVLIPSLLTTVGIHFIASPKQLVFDDGLYSTSECKQETISGHISHAGDSLLAGSSINLCRKYDEKLPESITKSQKDPSRYWSVYYHFIDPGNQHMTTTKRGRVFAALIGILGVFLLNGLLVSSIIGYIDSRKEKWLKGEVKYPRFLRRHKHYIIIGGNDMAFGIVQQILTREKSELPYILIQTARDVEEFRRELFSTLTEQQQKHIIIFYGSRTSKVNLEDLYLHNAEEIYVLGELTRVDELEPYHDSINMQCLDCIKEIRTENNVSKVVTCYVMFDYQTTFAAFQASKQKREIDGNIIFIPFNIHETWAQKILVWGKARKIEGEVVKYDILYNNIDEDGISYDSDKIAHIIIIGMSKMGTAMAIETAHLAHFPNFVRDNSKRTKITFIDKNAREESDFFMGRFPDLFKLCKWTNVDGNVYNEKFPGDIMSDNGEMPKKSEYSYFKQNFIDVEFEFREGGVETNANREYLKNCVKDKNAIVTIAVCLPLPHQSLAAALYLPHSVIEKANDIWVYQPQSAKLVLDITKQQEDLKYWDEVKYKKLKPFGMQDGGFDEKLINNKLVTYCQCFYNLKEEIKKNSPQYNEWTCNMISQKYEENRTNQLEKPQHIWEIWSNIYHLNMLNYKLRSFAEKDEESTKPIESNKNLIARVEHNRWNMEKLLMGYRPLRDRLIEDEDEINRILEFLSTKDASNETIEKIKCGKQNEKDIYISVSSVKKYYSDGPQKIHPNICPYDDTFLPDSDKEYDICFTLALPFLKSKFEQNQQAND